MEVQVEDGWSCRTPRPERCRIPAAACPPPPPRKKPGVYLKHRPKEGYFDPPDIELFFSVAFGRLQEAADGSH